MSISINSNFFSNYSSYSNIFGVKSNSSSSSLFQSTNTAKNSNAYNSNNIYNILNLKYGVNNAKNNSYSTTSESVRTLGNQVSSAISSLATKGTQSLFNKFTAASTDNKIATATVDNSKFGAKSISPLELNVKQVAKAQTNTGFALKSAGLEKAVSQGNYSFAINSGGKSQQFSIKVDYTDDNESIQKKMAAAINNSKGLGVTASVSYDSENKTSQLSLTSTTTGNKNQDETKPVFSVEDLDSGKLASKMGITQVSQQAQNAIYSVNGGTEKTSASNSIDLGNGITANLKDAGKTTLSFQKDGSDAVSKVKELVNTLNSAIGEALSGNGRGSDRLGQDITTMNKSYSSTLRNVGINVSNGGYLSIDETKLKKASEDGSLERLFQDNKNSGFANRANRISGNMSTSNYYADSPIQNNSSSNFNNFYNYGKYGSAGMLFDSVF